MPQTLQQLSLPDNPVLRSLSFLPRAASSRVPVYEPTPRKRSPLPSKLCFLNSLGFRRCQIRTFPKKVLISTPLPSGKTSTRTQIGFPEPTIRVNRYDSTALSFDRFSSSSSSTTRMTFKNALRVPRLSFTLRPGPGKERIASTELLPVRKASRKRK